jgi:hypothetical protein
MPCHRRLPIHLPEQLNAARRQRREEGDASRASAQEEQTQLRERRSTVVVLQARQGELASRVKGLYDEIDKLAKKVPTMPSTVLIVEKTNRAITAVKEFVGGPAKEFLGADDPFLSEVEPFVPAGDQPEHRDVLMTLRDLRDALARVEEKLNRESWELAKRDEENPLSPRDRLRADNESQWRA